MRVARSAFACALPRPSAIASAKLAKSTVSQSQKASEPVNQSGSWPVSPRTASITKIAETMTLPSSTMKMTGLWNWVRGSSFLKESVIAVATISRVNRLSERVVIARSPRPERG